jgi:hypothetical protein
MERISPQQRFKKYGYGKNDFLKADEVGVYLFKYNQRKEGYRTRLLEVSPEEGISESGFLGVHDQLYEEGIRLERDLAPSESVCD